MLSSPGSSEFGSRRRGPTASAPRRLGGHRELTMTRPPLPTARRHSRHARPRIALSRARRLHLARAERQVRRADLGQRSSRPPPGWMAAAPADTLTRGPWWTLFNDPVLNQLAPQVAVFEPERGRRCGRRRAIVGRGAPSSRPAFFPTLSRSTPASRAPASAARADRASPPPRRTAPRWSPRARPPIAHDALFGSAWARAGRPTCGARVANSVSRPRSRHGPGQRGRSRERDAVRAGRPSSPTTCRCARPTPRSSIAADHHRRLRALAQDHAEPLRRGDRGRRATCCRRRRTLANAQARRSRRCVQQRASSCSTRWPCSPARHPPNVRAARRATGIPPAVPGDPAPACRPSCCNAGPDIAAAERRVAAANAQDRRRARRVLSVADAQRRMAARRSPSLGDLFNASSFAWSLGAVAGRDDLRRRRPHRARRRGAAPAWKESRGQLSADGADRVLRAVEDQLSSRQRARGAAEAAAPSRLGRPLTRPSRIMQNQLQAGAGRLHRRRHGAGFGAQRATLVDAGVAEPADGGHQHGVRSGRRVVDGAVGEGLRRTP